MWNGLENVLKDETNLNSFESAVSLNRGIFLREL